MDLWYRYWVTPVLRALGLGTGCYNSTVRAGLPTTWWTCRVPVVGRVFFLRRQFRMKVAVVLPNRSSARVRLESHARHHRRSVNACRLAFALCLSAAVTSCGGLTQSSSYTTFLSSSPQAQMSVIDSLSGKYQTPDFATPLGEPEVAYYCASHPRSTLRQFFVGARAAGY